MLGSRQSYKFDCSLCSDLRKYSVNFQSMSDEAKRRPTNRTSFMNKQYRANTMRVGDFDAEWSLRWFFCLLNFPVSRFGFQKILGRRYFYPKFREERKRNRFLFEPTFCFLSKVELMERTIFCVEISSCSFWKRRKKTTNVLVSKDKSFSSVWLDAFDVWRRKSSILSPSVSYIDRKAESFFCFADRIFPKILFHRVSDEIECRRTVRHLHRTSK